MIKTPLIILAILTVLSGVGYYFISSNQNEILRVIYLAFLYMPIPLYSLIIYSGIRKENIIKKYINLRELQRNSLLLVIFVFSVWVIVTSVLTIVLNVIFPNAFAHIAVSNQEIVQNVIKIAGESSSTSMNLPPFPLLLIPIGLISAIIAGLSINLIFALGEEIMWRGYLWDKFKFLGDVKSTLLIGFIWGLWHSPIILQGYNYGVMNGVLGSAMFIIFCMAFSFMFTIVLKRTGSTILAASLHGMFNAFAGIYLILLVNANPFIDGAIGIVSIFAIIITVLILNYIWKLN